MEAKINIAEILKNKPQGTKLYNLLYNIDVELDTIVTTGTKTIVWCTDKIGNTDVCHRFYSEFGTIEEYPDGLQILFPSKEMRDWNKFAWKKGDVLKNTAYEERVIFDGFLNDDYTYFKGKHPLDCSNKFNITYHEECNCFTGNYRLESKDTAQIYINTIEERLGGKLNCETLEVEKAQPEFKDGDIAFADYGNRQDVFIVSDKTNLSEGYNSFISLDLSGLTLNMGYRTSFFKSDLCKLRLATEEEKQQLFDALAKEGKAWDAKKKQIVDLKPKVELKPFDKVVVFDELAKKWECGMFSHYSKNYEGKEVITCIGGCTYFKVLPFNEETAKLLGTTNNVEG